MRETEPHVDLSLLETDYEIVGELEGPNDSTRVYIANAKSAEAKRRDDQPGVVISTYTTPEGDEGNALSHLAADTKTLASIPHRRLVPVVEGRWLGDDAFAIVTRRITDPTLAQKLATGEAFSTPRIAAILRELSGLLDWARQNSIVHRGITAEGVFLGPKTDQVRVVFDVTPLHRVRPDDETRDARTVARLAMAMLAGVELPDACDASTLHEARPELPARLTEETDKLLETKNGSTAADIAAYIALIGMSDPLYRGEEEEKRIRAEILEEQRVEREKLAAARDEFAAFMAMERATLEALRIKERAKLDADRATLEREVAEERTKLQRAVEKERADLLARRTELEKIVTVQQTELERAAAADRSQIEALRSQLKARGEAEIEKKRQTALEEVDDSASVVDDETLEAPRFALPTLAPLEPLTFDDTNPVFESEPIRFASPEPEDIAVEEPLKPIGGLTVTSRRRLIQAGTLAAAIALVAIAGFAVASRQPARQSVPVARPVVAQAPVISSAARPTSTVPLPVNSFVVESAGGVVANLPDSAAMAAKKAADLARKSRAARDSTRRRRALADTIFDFRALPSPRIEATPRRDSSLKRDSIAPKRDSVAPDTTKPL